MPRLLSVIARLRAFGSMRRSDRFLLIEAVSLMAMSWLGLRLIPFSQLRRMLDCLTARDVGTVHDQDARTVSAVSRAVTAVASRWPAATCLVQALAAHVMLRRRGAACHLRIGVRPRCGARVPFEAHAWVECDGMVAIGDLENLSEFKLLMPASRGPA